MVIDSTLDESEKLNGRFCVTDESRRGEDGALLCYPVDLKPLADVAFVISVCYSVRGAFKKRYSDSYKKILEPFALRLRLEYSLLGLKELIDNDDPAKTAGAT